MTLGAAVLMAMGISAPAGAVDLQMAYVTPAELTPQLAAARQQPEPVQLRPSFGTQPVLTNELLAAYVARQQELKSFSSFDVQPANGLNEQVLLGYIDRTRGTRNLALDAIDSFADQPALTDQVLSVYAQKKFVPTVKKVQFSNAEKLCLTQAIYHEARGESEEGQWAVANVIINRAMSHKFPATLCGVVFQNADQGYHHCQFTFACDGKSDFGSETGAWNKATKMAALAYSEFKQGERPGVIPSSALYYHTTSVNPDWSNKFRRVATIGAHEFYAGN
ncbi:MAG TPA: cell wall hydrolase [Hypericibacter adhaerens]|uniref:cell wall hydrolase n=1 Tax=Hypericibacter adhaerens TaxID=2602016 RepID=UPI002C869C4D|nr:cell wall hydrolase [Hypericibacter adhaerens]HWA42945.1 cell wall hydrolase [Hypericibacter adhaerens]